MTNVRLETDLLGTREIPAGVLWGIHTLRAVENFPPTGAKLNPALISAFADVKRAAALTNAKLGMLDDAKADAIVLACEEIARGAWHDQFLVDALQGGAGTSTNMNVNEVVANRANAILAITAGTRNVTRGASSFDCSEDALEWSSGAECWWSGSASFSFEPASVDKAIPTVHPIADVNLHQSTNDAFPTALRIAAIRRLRSLSETIARLQGALQRKEKEFARVVKMGRTELQDAVPMTLGMEFSAFAEAMGRDRWRISKCEERMRVINLGGTAIGTGIAAPTEYIFRVTEQLREVTGLGLARGENLVAETANSDAFVEVSGLLKAHATTLLKMASDLRILALLGEIHLPALQAGSSIMPGKVNPVLLEMASQIAIKVLANDLIVAEAASRSHLQINEFMPLLAHALLESIDLLEAIDQRLVAHIDGIEADVTRCQELVERSVTLVTALVPEIGYPAATDLVKEYMALTQRPPFLAYVSKKLGHVAAARILEPDRVAMLGYRGDARSAEPSPESSPDEAPILERALS